MFRKWARKRDKTKFFDTILDALGPERGREFLFNALEDLEEKRDKKRFDQILIKELRGAIKRIEALHKEEIASPAEFQMSLKGTRFYSQRETDETGRAEITFDDEGNLEGLTDTSFEEALGVEGLQEKLNEARVKRAVIARELSERKIKLTTDKMTLKAFGKTPTPFGNHKGDGYGSANSVYLDAIEERVEEDEELRAQGLGSAFRLIAIQVGWTHEIYGHEAGFDDEEVLTREDVVLTIELFKALAREKGLNFEFLLGKYVMVLEELVPRAVEKKGTNYLRALKEKAGKSDFSGAVRSFFKRIFEGLTPERKGLLLRGFAQLGREGVQSIVTEEEFERLSRDSSSLEQIFDVVFTGNIDAFYELADRVELSEENRRALADRLVTLSVLDLLNALIDTMGERRLREVIEPHLKNGDVSDVIEKINGESQFLLQLASELTQRDEDQGARSAIALSGEIANNGLTGETFSETMRSMFDLISQNNLTKLSYYLAPFASLNINDKPILVLVDIDRLIYGLDEKGKPILRPEAGVEVALINWLLERIEGKPNFQIAFVSHKEKYDVTRILGDIGVNPKYQIRGDYFTVQSDNPRKVIEKARRAFSSRYFEKTEGEEMGIAYDEIILSTTEENARLYRTIYETLNVLASGKEAMLSREQLKKLRQKGIINFDVLRRYLDKNGNLIIPREFIQDADLLNADDIAAKISAIQA